MVSVARASLLMVSVARASLLRSPLDVANYLVGVHLDTGKLTSQTPLCSLMPGPKTNPQSCPWSLEVGA